MGWLPGCYDAGWEVSLGPELRGLFAWGGEGAGLHGGAALPCRLVLVEGAGPEEGARQ